MRSCREGSQYDIADVPLVLPLPEDYAFLPRFFSYADNLQ